MKKIMLTTTLLLLYSYIFCQDFPNLTFDQIISSCSVQPNIFDTERPDDDIFVKQCNTSSWKPISFSPDLISRRVNGITERGFKIGTGRSYGQTCPNSPCTPAERVNCSNFNTNAGEGIMCKSLTFKKGRKYFLSMDFKIELAIQQINNTDTRLDFAGIKLSNNGIDITSQCTFQGDCTDHRPAFNSITDFTSIPGQQIWNGAGEAMTSFQKVELCFTANEDYSQMLFFAFESVSDIGGNVSIDDKKKTFWLKIYNLKISCCEEIKEYFGNQDIPFYPPSSLSSGNTLRLPVITEVKDRITAFPKDGNVVVRNNEKVTFRAGNRVELKSGINQKKFIVEQGATFKIEIKPCSNCTSNEGCTANYIPPNTPGVQTGGFDLVYLPNLFDPSGTHSNPMNHRFFPQTNSKYPMPFNAYYAKMDIFEGTNNNQVFSAETTASCNGIDPFKLSWNGCFNGQPSATNRTYTWQLILENCYGREVRSGSVNIALPSANCSTNLTYNGNDNTLSSAKASTNKNLIEEHKLLQKDNQTISLSSNYGYDVSNLIFTKSDIKIYPNPARDKALVVLSTPNPDSYNIYISDIAGKIIKKIKTGFSINESEQFDIDISDIPSGSYIIYAKSNNSKSKVSQKFIKN